MCHTATSSSKISDVGQAGVNGFLDIARQTYKEANQDAYDLVESLNGDLSPIAED